MLALTLVALSVGLSNLAAAIGIGAGGVSRATRFRVGLLFGLFEAGMPVLGLLAGHGLATAIGRQANWLAAGLLAAVGAYMIGGALRGGRGKQAARSGVGEAAGSGVGEHAARSGVGAPSAARSGGGVAETVRLGVSGLALSADNLVAGFALGSYRVSVLTGAVIFGVVSVAMSLAGLEFGARIGQRAGERGQLVGGVIVVAVGVAVGFGALG